MNTDSPCAGNAIHIASEAFRTLKRLSRRVPEDISMVGFGNLESGEQTFRITANEQHPLALGHAAAEALVDRIEGRVKPGVNRTIPVELAPGDRVAVLKDARNPPGSKDARCGPHVEGLRTPFLPA